MFNINTLHRLSNNIVENSHRNRICRMVLLDVTLAVAWYRYNPTCIRLTQPTIKYICIPSICHNKCISSLNNTHNKIEQLMHWFY